MSLAPGPGEAVGPWIRVKPCPWVRPRPNQRSRTCITTICPPSRAEGNNYIMQKLCKENEGKPKCCVLKREEKRSYGEFECQQTEGNFRQSLLQSLEEFKEDTDYRHFNNEEMTREMR
ncbi:hypothetical protein QTO34_018581 [Cnephaeus nilssonii]|uniref:Uncharacterized protein n=1 Tax=Cnephaeus nilssonii TaxID=3371016 RepID=A0AA40I045_CNENI|nr:hypothetical protein QTO34_018581 [Eptesicus nilssonii]